LRNVVGKGGDACVSASYALWTSYNGGLGFYVWNDDEQVVAGRIGPSEIWDGRWHHVAGTFDGSRAQFFVDGRSIEGSTLPTSVGTPPGGGPAGRRAFAA
jgi:hypothetical protein